MPRHESEGTDASGGWPGYHCNFVAKGWRCHALEFDGRRDKAAARAAMALGRIATNSAARREQLQTVTGTSQVRVLSELYEARLHEAQSVAEYLALWMYGRDIHQRGRITSTGFNTKGRIEAAFRQHLLLALQVAQNVKAAYPEFTLFGKKHELLEQALADVNEELLSSKNDEVMKMIEQRSSIAQNVNLTLCLCHFLSSQRPHAFLF